MLIRSLEIKVTPLQNVFMARIARVVLPGIPHHVTQRGVRSMPVFLSDHDRTIYLQLLAEQGKRFGVTFLAWCLMTNHVHLIAVPNGTDSLARGIGEAHRRYTRMINLRENVTGHLFQERFFSCPLDEQHLFAAVVYILRNPVRAGLVREATAYRWSSTRWSLGLVKTDPLVDDLGPLSDIADWGDLLRSDPTQIDTLREHTRSGRPCGDDDFVFSAERITGRKLKKRHPGRKPTEK